MTPSSISKSTEGTQMALEYRVCWSASSNISFHGHTDWETAEDWGETHDEIEQALEDDAGRISDLLEIALNASGFECWVETRDAE